MNAVDHLDPASGDAETTAQEQSELKRRVFDAAWYGLVAKPAGTLAVEHDRRRDEKDAPRREMPHRRLNDPLAVADHVLVERFLLRILVVRPFDRAGGALRVRVHEFDLHGQLIGHPEVVVVEKGN